MDMLDSLESFSKSLESVLVKVLDKTNSASVHQDLSRSIGIAVHESSPLVMANFIQVADKALYEAKTMGKRRFCINVEESSWYFQIAERIF